MSSALSVLVPVLVAGLAWGLNAPASKLLYAAGDGRLFDGVTLAVARSVWSLPVFVAAAFLVRPRGLRLRSGDLARFAWLGVLFGPGLTGVFAVAAQWTSAAHVVLITGLTPPATALIESLIQRRRLSVGGWAAIGLGVAGVALLSFTRSATGSTPQGDLLMLVWVASYAWFVLLTRALTERYPAPFLSVLSTGGGALIVAVVGIAAGAGGAVGHAFASPGVAAWFFGEIVVALGLIGPIANVVAIRRSSATIATTGALYASVAAGLLAAVLLVHERLAPSAVAAGVLLLASLALTFSPRGPRVAAAATSAE